MICSLRARWAFLLARKSFMKSPNSRIQREKGRTDTTYLLKCDILISTYENRYLCIFTLEPEWESGTHWKVGQENRKVVALEPLLTGSPDVKLSQLEQTHSVLSSHSQHLTCLPYIMVKGEFLCFHRYYEIEPAWKAWGCKICLPLVTLICLTLTYFALLCLTLPYFALLSLILALLSLN